MSLPPSNRNRSASGESLRPRAAHLSRPVAAVREAPVVVALVTTYNPNAGDLERLTSALLSQVDHIIVIDNGSREDIAERIEAIARSAVTCIRLGANFGVAAALNRGIEAARNMKAGALVFFDQDSVPAPDMVARLMAVLQRLQRAGVAVAAVGPRFRDPRVNNRPPFIRIQGGRVIRAKESRAQPEVEVDYLITSGSLVPMSAFDRVGLLEEQLFVDFVDIEWGLRAKLKGCRCFGVFTADMHHSLGEAPLRLLGATLPVHSPLRHYYHFRNAVWLTRQAWVPWQWKFVNSYRLVAKFAIYSLLAVPRMERVRMMLQGIRDGFAGKLGHYRD